MTNMSAIIPIPKTPIAVRAATMDDLPFIDGLQRKHTKQVGWMPTAQFEGKIKAGHVLIAEEAQSDERRAQSEESDADATSSICAQRSALCASSPVGYCIGNDQYFKRDDVGIIYQMNVVPGRQRGLVGATLLKAQFERSAWGCKLYCCWCAQDIAANYFWESLGFVPLAFRAGSERRSRIHIFWQRRIRSGDETTPYWFPAQTSSGSIREDRIVLPIPPGTHWSDAKPLVLPTAGVPGEARAIEDATTGRQRGQRAAAPKLLPPTNARVQFGRPSANPQPAPVAKEEKPAKLPKPKRKNDPKLVAAARELRDRWMEQVNGDAALLLGAGKYDVSRALAGSEVREVDVVAEMPALPAPDSTSSPQAIAA
jgi:hypothetical protein